jgi:peptidoglycan/xylan/chitin deacetylase (PgdA/CDA1 family)
MLFSVLFLILLATADSDRKRNCSEDVKGNFCYNGPQFDSVGQYESCSVPGTIALTFDDGPSKYTGHILDVLKEHNMKATFFFIGRKIHDFHNIVQRTVDEGHQIGSHTYHHVNLDNSTICPDPYKEMIEWENALIAENFTGQLNGTLPNYMRPPHGALDNYTYYIVRHLLGYLPMNWGFLTGDTDEDSGKNLLINASGVIPIYETYLGGPYGEGVNAPLLDLITQQHDTMQATSDSFENLTIYLENIFGSQGVRFVTVADCLGNTIPAFRPYPNRNPPTLAISLAYPQIYFSLFLLIATLFL